MSAAYGTGHDFDADAIAGREIVRVEVPALQEAAAVDVASTGASRNGGGILPNGR